LTTADDILRGVHSEDSKEELTNEEEQELREREKERESLINKSQEIGQTDPVLWLTNAIINAHTFKTMNDNQDIYY